MTVAALEAAWLIPLYPLLAAVASLAWSPGLISRTGPRPCGYLNLLMVAVAFGHSLIALTALVLTDSLFFSYVILELLTLGTYLIVGTWTNQPLVVKGARDAFLTKRIGDLILLGGRSQQ
ncbi:MAG: proton-conducting transporter membrane subunit [Prochlorococcaceae cyanobacterium]